jgi:hypothetical protein
MVPRNHNMEVRFHSVAKSCVATRLMMDVNPARVRAWSSFREFILGSLGMVLGS